MTTKADNAETLAVRAALAAFVERLNGELHALNHVELAEFEGSLHKHWSLLLAADGKTFAVATYVFITSDPRVVAGALANAKDKGTA